MYNVVISPDAIEVLKQYTIICNTDNEPECAKRLIDSFDKGVSLLEVSPTIGCSRLGYIPKKYRVTTFWSHLWFVYQVNEKTHTVTIDYIIDDHQNYGTFLNN